MLEKNWYGSLCDQINDHAQTWGLDESQSLLLRDFVMGVARDQFKAGNRSGATWAFEQARKKIAAGQTV